MDEDIQKAFEDVHTVISDLAGMVARGFQSIENRMATKEDQRALVTKDEFRKEAKRLQGGQECILEAIIEIPSKESFERFETKLLDRDKRINVLERRA